jgi:hypothetical protein
MGSQISAIESALPLFSREIVGTKHLKVRVLEFIAGQPEMQILELDVMPVSLYFDSHLLPIFRRYYLPETCSPGLVRNVRMSLELGKKLEQHRIDVDSNPAIVLT